MLEQIERADLVDKSIRLAADNCTRAEKWLKMMIEHIGGPFTGGLFGYLENDKQKTLCTSNAE